MKATSDFRVALASRAEGTRPDLHFTYYVYDSLSLTIFAILKNIHICKTTSDELDIRKGASFHTPSLRARFTGQALRVIYDTRLPRCS